MSQKRVGVFGGTFDPVHLGHLIVAEDVREKLRLDEVWFVPSPAPPHKAGREVSPPSHRVAMLELALKGTAGLRVSGVELEGGEPSPRYSVDTMRRLKETFPQVLFSFIVGFDQVADLPDWKEPGALVRICQVIAIPRPGASALEWERIERSVAGARSLIRTVEVTQVDISASDIRNRVASGRSIRYRVPPAVEAYILEHGLYTKWGRALRSGVSP